MNRLLVVAAVLASLLLTHTAPPSAQIRPNPQPSGIDAQRKRDAAVTECVSSVRKERASPKFDAYAAGSQVRVYGSPEEQLQFERCMAQQGQPSR